MRDASRDREIVQEYLQGAELYRQGGSGCLFFTATAFDRCLEVVPGVSIGFYGHDELDFAFNKAAMVAVAQRVLDNVTDRNSEISIHWSEWRKRQQYHDEYATHFATYDLRTVGRQALVAELLQYQKVLQYIWENAFVIDCFDPDGHAQLERMVFLHHPTVTDDERIQLVQHQLPTTQMLLERSALQGLLHGDHELEHLLQNGYHWMANDYAHAEQLSLEHFAAVIDKCQQEYPTRKQQEARVRTIDRWQEDVLAHKEQLYRKYAFTTVEQGIVRAFSDLTDWREERKRKVQQSAVIFQRFVDALSVEYGLEPELLRNHDPRDGALLDSEQVREVLTRRAKNGVLQVFNSFTRESYFVDDVETIRLFRSAGGASEQNDGKSFSGQIGMKGVVTGVVKIITGPKDFAKFVQGDILVSPMTRPELMPVIRKASGIITDEGGITCHAALVARELKIPCVIGTQCASRVLHDGDRVVLDATTGEVRLV